MPTPTPKPTPSIAPSPSPTSTWKSQTITPGSTSSGTVNPERYQSGFGTNSLVTLVDENAQILFSLSDEERTEIAKLLKSAGYRVPITGKYNKTLADEYTKAFYDAQNQGIALGQDFTVRDFLAQEAAARAAFESGSGKPSTTVSVRQYTPEQREGLIQANYQKYLNRPATAKEVKSLSSSLKKALAENPGKTTYETRNGITYQTTTPGLDPADFILDFVVGTKEFAEREAVSPDLQKRIDEKRIFNTATRNKSPEEIEELLQTTQYGRGVSSIKARIEEAITEIGGTATPEEVSALSAQVYERAIENNPELVRKLIRDTIKVTPGDRPGGEAGKNFAVLKQTAAANGIDLNKMFGSEVQGWLQKIAAGESIDTFKQTIRDVAKMGMPENVVNLLDRGVDLETIYSPYRKVMASTLDLNPETISMNDTTLRAAIGPDREMSVYDFEKALRKDKRWEFSQQARDEVSTLVNKVLKDFGFVG